MIDCVHCPSKEISYIQIKSVLSDLKRIYISFFFFFPPSELPIHKSKLRHKRHSMDYLFALNSHQPFGLQKITIIFGMRDIFDENLLDFSLLSPSFWSLSCVYLQNVNVGRKILINFLAVGCLLPVFANRDVWVGY